MSVSRNQLNTIKNIGKGAIVKISFVGNKEELISFATGIDNFKKKLKNSLDPIHIYHVQKVLDDEEQNEATELENEIMEKGEVVSFSNSKKDKQAQKTPRKSVDLDDLRKTLEESLASKSKSSEEELEERIEEEKDADKVSGDE